MSFVAPTSNVIAITSGQQIIASGNVTITLNIKDLTSVSDSNFTMDVIDLGSIELDFNYIEDIGNVNEFTINVPRLEFQIRDELTSTDTVGVKESFVEMISELDASDLIVAKVQFDSGSDYYYTTREQCEFSYMDRKVKLQLQHPIKYGAIGFGKTWDATRFTGKYIDLVFHDEVNPPETINNSIHTKDLIVEYLDAIGDSTNVQYYSELYNGSYSDNVQIEDQIVVIGNDLTNRADTDFSIASNRVRSAALGEAAIIGNVLGYGFFVPRYSKNSDTQAFMSSDDFSDLELDISFKNVRYYSQSIIYGGSLGDTETVSVSNYLINEFGQNNVNVTYGFMTGYTGANWRVSEYVYGNDQWGGLPAGFATKIINTFKRIFRIADGSPNVDAGSYISGTILGIDKLKPYEYFSVGSGVHPLVDNKDFRPAYLKYNFIDDTIEFEAYEF